MNLTSSELLMRNFNEIFVELDPVRRLALLKESFTDDCLWVHPGGRIVGREVSMRRLQRSANIFRNTATPLRVRSRPCTTS